MGSEDKLLKEINQIEKYKNKTEEKINLLLKEKKNDR